MTEELFRKFVERKLDAVDRERVALESYTTIKELVSEMERMCVALQEFCVTHRFALQIGHVSLIIQGSFPGMDKQQPDGMGRVGYIFGGSHAVEENLKNIIATQEATPSQSIFQPEV